MPNNINTPQPTTWSGNTYSLNDLVAIQAAGAVFLPVGYYRTKAEVGGYWGEGIGAYWSTTNSTDFSAWIVYIGPNYYAHNLGSNREYGRSVRLVRN